MKKKKKFKIDKETRKELLDKSSSYALDLSKLVFGGVILAGIMGLNVDTDFLFGLGAISVLVLSFVGFAFIVLKHYNK